MIKQQEHDRGGHYTPSFSRGLLAKKSWLAVRCSEVGTLFLLSLPLFFFKQQEPNQHGPSQVRPDHFAEKVKRHEQAKSRMTNKENAPWHVGRVNIAAQLDEGYRTGV